MDNGQLTREWEVKRLDKVCALFTDGNWIESKDQSSEGIRLIQTGNVGNGNFKNRREKARWISFETFERLKCQEVFSGDCLVSRLPDPVGRACIIPETGDKMITAVDCSILRFNSGLISSDFFNYYSQSTSYLNDVENQCTGATRKRISRKNLGAIEIPLPPLPEQKRIVAILDEAFAGISLAVASAEKNLANARELFESYLNNVFTQKGEGWQETSLGDEIDLLTGFAFKSKEYTEASDDIKLLRGDNIIPNSFRWDGVKRWSKLNVGDYTQYYLEERDVVLAMDRTWIKAGVKYAQVSAEDLPCLLVQRVARLRVKSGLDSGYLKFLIGSEEFTRYVLSIQTGIGVPHISGKQIQNFKFCKPSLLETQKEISLKFNKLQIEIQQLESIYKQKLTALNELKQSILQKAFTGQLTRDN